TRRGSDRPRRRPGPPRQAWASPVAQGLGHLLSLGLRLMARSVPGVAGAGARPATVVRPVQPPLVQAARGLTFRRHSVPSPASTTSFTHPGRTLKDNAAYRPRVLPRTGATPSFRAGVPGRSDADPLRASSEWSSWT